MSFFNPALRIIGPEQPNEIASVKLTDPMFIKRDFQIRFVVNTENISVSDLKDSFKKIDKSIKN
jgi:hypothetical protein